MHLSNTNIGVRLVSSLDVYLPGTSLLVLPTSLQHLLSNLPEAATCVWFSLRIFNSHEERLRRLVCISSFVSVQLLWLHN